ncbi:MAG: HK97 gp10 family phage protein [Oscillospiraceae bacterium]|nr:HK97 gp10 family phage protein [Oscillospiraceae bacterium]
MDRFCQDVSKELAARLLALVIPRTPVGDYSKEVTVTVKRDGKHHKKGDTYTKRVTPSGKKGGTLRRGWTANTGDAAGYAAALPVTKTGCEYRIEVINPVSYASYVEFGHRQTPGRYVSAIGKALKVGWVEGKYFLTLSEQDLRSQAPGLIERKLEKQLQEVFNV